MAMQQMSMLMMTNPGMLSMTGAAPSNQVPVPRNPFQMQTPNNPMQAPSNRMPAPSNQVAVPNSQNQTQSNQVTAHRNQMPIPSNQTQAPSNQTPVHSNQVPTPTSSHSGALYTPPPGMPAMEVKEKEGDQEVVQNSRRRLSGRRRSDNSGK